MRYNLIEASICRLNSGYFFFFFKKIPIHPILLARLHTSEATPELKLFISHVFSLLWGTSACLGADLADI